MPVDTIIFKGFQGDEVDLQDRIKGFLNISPAKKILNISTWVVGIEVYVLIIFARDATEEKARINKVDQTVDTLQAKVGDY